MTQIGCIVQTHWQRRKEIKEETKKIFDEKTDFTESINQEQNQKHSFTKMN